MAIDTPSLAPSTLLTYVVLFVVRLTIYLWAKRFVRIIREAREFMEQQEVDQEQEAVFREETLGSGKAVIRNPNHHHHREEKILE
jgi:cytoskeletal protein RodZ